MAVVGLVRCMMFNASSAGYSGANRAGLMAKYFATSLAMENVVRPVSYTHLDVYKRQILHSSRSETRRGPTTVEFAVDRPLVAKAVVAVVAAGLAYGVAESFYANAVAPNVAVSRGDFWVAGAGFIALAIYIGIERPAASPIAIFLSLIHI